MHEYLQVRRETRAPFGVARVSGVALRVSFPATSFRHDHHYTYTHQRCRRLQPTAISLNWARIPEIELTRRLNRFYWKTTDKYAHTWTPVSHVYFNNIYVSAKLTAILSLGIFLSKFMLAQFWAERESISSDNKIGRPLCPCNLISPGFVPLSIEYYPRRA